MPDAPGWPARQILDWQELRVETVEEGHRRQMTLIHLPTGITLRAVGEHVSRKQMRRSLIEQMVAAIRAHVAKGNGAA